MDCDGTPHTGVGSLETQATSEQQYQALISCICDDIRPDPIDRFGKNIIQMPQDQGGWCVTETGERLYYVVFRPEAGRASVQNAQLRHLDPSKAVLKPRGVECAYPSSVSQSRDPRSARIVIDFSVANSLMRHFTLTYADEPGTPDACAHELEKFLRRVRRAHGPFPWVQVLERGEQTGRLHHHVLTGDSLALQAVVDLWGNGHVLYKRARSVTGIRRTAGYLCKTFSTPADDRLGSHRYRVSRYGIRPKARGMVVTESEYRALLDHLAPGRTYDWYPSEPVPFHEFSTLWDPHIKVDKNLAKSA